MTLPLVRGLWLGKAVHQTEIPAGGGERAAAVARAVGGEDFTDHHAERGLIGHGG